MARRHSSEPISLKATEGRPLAEIGASRAAEIEPITGSLSMDAAALEAFMNESVVIRVTPAREGGSLEVITPAVNGINQPIIRNQAIPVKRKYVEALASSYSITYEQKVQDPSRPENIQMVAKPVPDYPFEVVEDSAKGKAWLDAIYERIKQQVARA